MDLTFGRLEIMTKETILDRSLICILDNSQKGFYDLKNDGNEKLVVDLMRLELKLEKK